MANKLTVTYEVDSLSESIALLVELEKRECPAGAPSARVVGIAIDRVEKIVLQHTVSGTSAEDGLRVRQAIEAASRIYGAPV